MNGDGGKIFYWNSFIEKESLLFHLIFSDKRILISYFKIILIWKLIDFPRKIDFCATDNDNEKLFKAWRAFDPEPEPSPSLGSSQEVEPRAH